MGVIAEGRESLSKMYSEVKEEASRLRLSREERVRFVNPRVALEIDREGNIYNGTGPVTLEDIPRKYKQEVGKMIKDEGLRVSHPISDMTDEEVFQRMVLDIRTYNSRTLWS